MSSARINALLLAALGVLALLSLAVGFGGKSLMWGPVAASIVWGLGFSALLTLFAIPLVWRLAMGRVLARRAPQAF